MSIKSLSQFPQASLLASGLQGKVYAIGLDMVLKTVSKPVVWETFNDGLLPAEVLAIKWANTFNNLVVQFKDHNLVNKVHIIALERLFPCLPTAFSKEEIAAAIEVAESQLDELWASGWAHGDLKRPTEFVGHNPMLLFNNIMLTESNGTCVIRLVDLGCSMLEQYDENDLIEGYIVNDKDDWKDFKDWILNYPRD
jgi:hypothetical protein